MTNAARTPRSGMVFKAALFPHMTVGEPEPHLKSARLRRPKAGVTPITRAGDGQARDSAGAIRELSAAATARGAGEGAIIEPQVLLLDELLG